MSDLSELEKDVYGFIERVQQLLIEIVEYLNTDEDERQFEIMNNEMDGVIEFTDGWF